MLYFQKLEKSKKTQLAGLVLNKKNFFFQSAKGKRPIYDFDCFKGQNTNGLMVRLVTMVGM